MKRSLLIALFFLACHFGVLNRVSAAKPSVLLALAQNPDTLFLRSPHTDKLGSSSRWRIKVKAQATLYRSQQYKDCLFGDSISAGLGNTLDKHTFNFAMGGLSSVSLVKQLKILSSANIKCHKAIIAIGTNDAWYIIRDRMFVWNLRQAIAQVRAMRAVQVTLIPAFYSTIATSHNPNVAGSIQRIKEINALMRQVAIRENVSLATTGLQPLFRNQSLKENLTFDGVHLNESGKKIYRRFLLKILNSQPQL